MPDLAERPASNLPAALTELIGRSAAVGDLRALVTTSRLVTLVGSGGVGKTSLALETARQLVGEFAHGAWLVELGGFDPRGRGSGGGPLGAAGLGGAIAGPEPVDDLAELALTALDIRETAAAGRPATATDRLAGALRDRRALLVLDNCEHVIDEVAAFAERLLKAAPGPRILATSREPLGLAGEVVWSVPPLDVPPAPRAPAAPAGPVGSVPAGAVPAGLAAAGGPATAGRAPEADPADIAGYASVRLFTARAPAAAPGFRLDARTAPAVALLCRRLDGIPLALELAATRVRTLGVDGLVARLDDRFRLLATGYRGAPPRQRTLLAMIDWSWDLLPEAERAVLRRLAVHHDGATLEAAEAVCAGDGVDEPDVLDLLGRLVDRSLVVLDERPGDEPRYRLLESVAAYCVDRLRDAGELERTRRRHAACYARLARRAAPALRGPDQRRWLRVLDTEAANLRGALDHEVRRGSAAGALRLADALAWYWFLRGRLAEATRWFAATGAVVGAAGRGAEGLASLRAQVAAWHAGFALLRDAHAGGEEITRAAARVFDDIDDPARRARAEWFLGYAELEHGDVPASTELVTRALRTCEQSGDQWGQAAALATLAKIAHTHGDHAGVARAAGRSAELFRAVGDHWGLLQATEWLGGHAELIGDYERATRLQREGLELAVELSLWPDACVRLAWLGWFLLQRGEHDAARRHCEQALRLAAEQDFQLGTTFARMGLAMSARHAGRLDEAETALAELVAESRRHGTPERPAMQLPLLLVE
ncbi:AfsR/SARP family transcriptional regulator, partial [Frankia sp. CNm7]|uniref:ATP-binding protein n=1 Tax=Frankia nepalensis TaxID=1836974 RepID=UPI001D8BD79F|nr:AfsR/SARP family transcriptional regulator [Frankia nepalensis]